MLTNLINLCKQSSKKLFFVLVLGSLLVVACKSSKNKNVAFDSVKSLGEQNNYNGRQNFTTKYNILFNAKSMLSDEGEIIFKNNRKNYQVRQQVFDEPMGNGEAHQLMDSLIQKAYKIINNKQESKYVNEAYYIVGQANYYKGAYHTAIEFFNHVIRNTYATQPEFLAPAYAWKSRALLQIGKTVQAKNAVDSALITLDENKKTRTLVNASLANYHLRVENPLAAIPYLEYALESNSNTLDKYRWTFLLGQLHKEAGNHDKALTYFKQIARSNVPYEMSFEADLQAAYLQGNTFSAIEDRVKPLKRMLGEGKNDGFQDQILFQIGDIHYHANEIDKALRYFNQSLRQPKRNAYQATESYLKLADHYFGAKQYYPAQRYYDSVAMILPVDYTDATKLRRKLTYMNQITDLYQQVAWQDTLLAYARMNRQELDQLLTKEAEERLTIRKQELEKLKASAKKKRTAKTEDRHTQQIFALQSPEGTANSSAQLDRTFYFSNMDELALGQAAFKRRWGNRQLQDNWRYAPDLMGGADPIGNVSQEVIPLSLDSLDENQFIKLYKDRYLSQLPQTEEQQEKAHKSIHDNLIMIGNIYRDYTQDNRYAIDVYEEFLRRYPNTHEGPSIYYSLYRMYADFDAAKSQEYLARLIQLYPNSIHAKVAEDPAYMDKINRDKNLLDRIFERLFNLYASGDHVAVIREADDNLKERFDNSALVAQVEYLRALAIGRVGRVEDFQRELASIIERYPDNNLVTPLAKENLAFIEQNPSLFVNRVNALQDINTKRIPFVDEPDMTAWPALSISGDYRSGIALVKELPKPVEDKPIPKPVVEEKKEELIAKVEEVKKEELVAQIEEKKEEESKQEELVEIEEVIAKVEEESVKEEELKQVTLGDALAGIKHTKLSKAVHTAVKLENTKMPLLNSIIDFGPNDFRDKELFPDTAEYYYVINVIDARVNLSPSRYGIGQFNRTRYPQGRLQHNLQVINGENQLVLIGPFATFADVKTYESRISTMMPEIMKVPVEIYNTFVITKEALPLLTDGVEIKKYYQNYTEQ